MNLLSWVLGALVLRALIPPGFMPMPDGTMAAAMCSTQGASEIIGIPGAPTEMQCDYCIAPTFAGPSCWHTTVTPVDADSVPAALEVPARRYELIRTQRARAPPA